MKRALTASSEFSQATALTSAGMRNASPPPRTASRASFWRAVSGAASGRPPAAAAGSGSRASAGAGSETMTARGGQPRPRASRFGRALLLEIAGHVDDRVDGPDPDHRDDDL